MGIISDHLNEDNSGICGKEHQEAINILEDFLATVEASNRECEDVNDKASVAFSKGLEDGIYWAIEELSK